MYSWTAAPVASLEQIQLDPNVMNQHAAAVQERLNVSGFSTWLIGISDTSGEVTTVASGTDIQTRQWFSRCQPDGTLPDPYYVGMQYAIGNMMGDFVNHIAYPTFEGLTSNPLPAVTWDLPSLRDAAGLPTLFQLPPANYANGSAYGYSVPNLATLPANTGWRRKRPRNVDSNTSPTYSPTTGELSDEESNPAVTGQHAYHADGTAQLLWECTDGAAGNWQRATKTRTGGTVTPLVDQLDNSQNAPNCITTDNWSAYIAGGTSIHATIFATMAAAGDYFGTWLFDEVRAMTNLLRWTQLIPTQNLPAVYDATIYNCYEGVGTSTTSYADAQANLAANWAPAFYGGGPVTGPYCYASAQYDGTTWTVYGQRSGAVFSYSGLPTPINKKVITYLYCQPVQYQPTGWNAPIFDAQGSGAVNGAWHAIDSTTTAAATIGPIAFGGDDTAPPPNFPPDPASRGNGAIGWQTANRTAVEQFDVPGGFTYVF